MPGNQGEVKELRKIPPLAVLRSPGPPEVLFSLWILYFKLRCHLLTSTPGLLLLVVPVLLLQQLVSHVLPDIAQAFYMYIYIYIDK